MLHTSAATGRAAPPLACLFLAVNLVIIALVRAPDHTQTQRGTPGHQRAEAGAARLPLTKRSLGHLWAGPHADEQCLAGLEVGEVEGVQAEAVVVAAVAGVTAVAAEAVGAVVAEVTAPPTPG